MVLTRSYIVANLLSLLGIAIAVAMFADCAEDRRITTNSPEALNAYQAGIASWEKFYYTEALQHFDKAVALDSGFVMAWARRAVVHEGTQNTALARQDLARAMVLSPQASTYERMFVRHWDLRLNHAFHRAALVADSMVKLFPAEKEVYLLRGNLFELEKNMDAAIRSYRQAIDSDTAYPLAVMFLGYAYSTIGDQKSAVEQMERYIRLAPDVADTRASFADILLRVGRYDEALEQYGKSLELKPDYWYSLNQIGAIYLLQGKLKAAGVQMHMGMRLLPHNPARDATLMAIDGNLNLQRGEYATALDQYHAALKVDSLNPEAAYGSVLASIKLKKLEDALRILDEIHNVLIMRNLAESREMLRWYVLRARIFLESGHHETALSMCDSAFEFSTALSRGPIYRQIAEIRIRQGRYEDALDACDDALRVNPNNPEVLFTLLKVYHAAGDRRMVNEIGGRLLRFWAKADPDFHSRRILSTSPGPGSTSSHMISSTESNALHVHGLRAIP
jgi:tetratricopeptide (TPR) repeat protein